MEFFLRMVWAGGNIEIRKSKVGLEFEFRFSSFVPAG